MYLKIKLYNYYIIIQFLQMNYYLLLFILLLPIFSVANKGHLKEDKKQIFYPIAYEAIEISGFAGDKIDLCINEQIKKRDIEHLIEPFRNKTETRLWQSEFWGKWMLSAVDAWKYKHDGQLMKTMQTAVASLLETQLENGYIGNYAPGSQLEHWDIWGRKYSMLGLIRYFEISGDENALTAAQKVADHLLSQVGPGKKDITFTGNYHGMASSSVLEPIVYLYSHTGEKRYLDFAEYIVKQWETADGAKLISKALNNIPVSERFPHPEVWWSRENGQKAYEMMSCYEGLLQLYLVTGTPQYLEAVKKTAENIIETEINIAGSGSAFECWYHGIEHQTRPTYHTMETCVSVTWMKLCFALLQITGNPEYGDQVEKTFYNALLASMKADGSEIAKYSPLEGRRHAGEEQCGMHINCCNANGPRGFALIPGFAFMKSGNGLVVNFYAESEITAEISPGNQLKLAQHTSYPENGKVVLTVSPELETEFEIKLRIPNWSKQTTVLVNGENVEKINSGSYLTILRKWKKGDKIELSFDMRGRLTKLNGFQSVERGPIVLARFSRFNDGFTDETSVIQAENGFVNLIPATNKPENCWMAFTAPLVLGTDLEGEMRTPRQIGFCDFGSAGNTWDAESRYRVWLPETLNVMKSDYKGY